MSRPRPWAFIDLFSGCGGLSAGLLAAGGFQHLFAADNDPWANATYETNLGYRPEQIDLIQLADLEQRRVWAEGLRSSVDGRHLLLAGGPPCQGFSSHVKVKGDRRERNQLFTVFGTLALELQPDLILIENVADLVSTRSWMLFSDLRERLRDGGYEVRARILNMAQLGVPQERFRTVVIASRIGPVHFPAVQCGPTEYSTVKDWIGDLPPIASGETNYDDPMHETSRHRQSTLDILRQVPPDGGSRPPGVGPNCLDRTRGAHGGYTDVYGRLAWSSPAPTITARCRTPSCGRFAHPEQLRGLTAREAGLLQTFPRSWRFIGPFDDRYKQIGNAVPPLAAQAFGRHILAGLPPVETEVGLYEVGDEPVGTSFSVLIPGIRRRGGIFKQ